MARLLQLLVGEIPAPRSLIAESSERFQTEAVYSRSCSKSRATDALLVIYEGHHNAIVALRAGSGDGATLLLRYIPLGGSRRKVLASAATFLFVAAWHDLEATRPIILSTAWVAFPEDVGLSVATQGGRQLFCTGQHRILGSPKKTIWVGSRWGLFKAKSGWVQSYWVLSGAAAGEAPGLGPPQRWLSVVGGTIRGTRKH